MKKLLILSLAVAIVSATSCNDSNQVSDSGATQSAPFVVPKNSEGRTTEQQNIHDRQEVTTDPAQVMWIHIIGIDGTIVTRMAVRCKVTSSGKRLEPKNAVGGESVSGYPTYNGVAVNELIGPDGTYGSSDPYVYWFDPMGRYHQLGTAGGLSYLLTDYPIDLQDPIDAVTGMYQANQAAAAWQAEQEAQLAEQEGIVTDQ